MQGGQFRSSAVGSLKSVIKAVCKEESPFFSNANLFVDMPRITELLEDNMRKYGIPEDSSEKIYWSQVAHILSELEYFFLYKWKVPVDNSVDIVNLNTRDDL